MDVPSREVERAENCQVKRSMGVLDLHSDSSALSVSPILDYSCKYFFRYSFVQFASCEFSGRRYNDCMSGDWVVEGCTAGESITGEYGFVFSCLFCLKFLQDEYISQFCRSNICFHSFR